MTECDGKREEISAGMSVFTTIKFTRELKQLKQSKLKQKTISKQDTRRQTTINFYATIFACRLQTELFCYAF